MRVFIIHFDINPSGKCHGVHHGVAFLLGAIKKARHEASFYQLVDENLVKDMRQKIFDYKPDILGISLVTNQFFYFKKYLPQLTAFGVKIIVGGIHPTIQPEAVLKLDGVDGVCIGEGEIAIKLLLERLEKGKPIYDTPSFMWKCKTEVIKNPILPLEPNLSKFDLPDYSMFDTMNLSIAVALLIRGCPYNCSYCCNQYLRNVYLNRMDYVRFPGIDHAILQIKHTLKFFPNASWLFFEDDLFSSNKKWLIGFCKRYKEDIGFPFGCNVRVENMDDETLEILKSAGVVRVNFGIESGNEWVRKNLLGRRYTNEEIINLGKKLKKNNISFFSYNMMGLPFETREQINSTVRINYELMPNDGGVFYFYPYPATKLWKMCKEFGLLTKSAECLEGCCQAPAIKLTHVKKTELQKSFLELRAFLLLRGLVTEFKGRLLFLWLLKFRVVNRLFVIVIKNVIKRKILFKSAKWTYHFLKRDKNN